jgi:hypothetical protein
MLRISDNSSPAGQAVLRLEGRLSGPWVAEASRLCDQWQSPARSLTLDLRELVYLDRSGAELLVRLRKEGVHLVNGSPFVEEQLKALG